jgi:hypothetical protein
MPQEAPQKNNAALVVAIIGVVGTIVAALITTMGNYNVEKLRQETELTRIAQTSIATQVVATQIAVPQDTTISTPDTSPSPNYGTWFLGLAGLLLTMLGLISKQDDNVEIRKILAWIIFTAFTLLIPIIFIFWLAMQIAIKTFPPAVINLSAFVTQVNLWAGGTSVIYLLIWRISLFPQIRTYIREKIFVISSTRKTKTRGTSKETKAKN